MARAPLVFKQSDVRRALRAARDAGYDIARVKIARDGAIELMIGKPATEPAELPEASVPPDQIVL